MILGKRLIVIYMEYTVTSRKIVIVNSRYTETERNRAVLNRTCKLFLLALILHNIECRLIIMLPTTIEAFQSSIVFQVTNLIYLNITL